MANGDAAAAAGMSVVAGTADLRNAYDEINKSRDYSANHQTGGTHPASAIASGILAVARIPDLDAAKVASGILAVARIPDLAGSKITSAVANATNATSASSASYASRAGGSDGPHATAISGAGPWYSAWVDGSHNFVRNTSSKRYKKNIRDLVGTVQKWAALRPRIFDRKDGITNESGYIAEEVFEVAPELVTMFWETDEDGNQVGERVIDGVRYDLIGALAVSDIARYVLELEQRILTLEKGVS